MIESYTEDLPTYPKEGQIYYCAKNNQLHLLELKVSLSLRLRRSGEMHDYWYSNVFRLAGMVVAGHLELIGEI